MLIAEVKNLTHHERLIYWIRERQQIYLKKRTGQKKPWTDDQILQSYRFCNVLRIKDAVSDWLLKSWYDPHKDHANMLLACTLARQLNNVDALGTVDFPLQWEPERVQNILEARADAGLKNYSAAYMITSRYGQNRAPETKPYQTVWRVCQPVFQSKLQINSSSMELTWRRLLPFQGFSSFIAGQVTADLRWGVSGEWSDKDDWAPMGPGSMRGLNRYHGRPLENKMTQAEFIREFRTLFNQVRKAPRIPRMEAMDFQSCLCEFDKYTRCLNGEGRPKFNYSGT